MASSADSTMARKRAVGSTGGSDKPVPCRPPACTFAASTASGRVGRWLLKDKLQRELDDARIERRCDDPEIGGAEHGVRSAEVRRVQEIEDLGTDLDRPA